MTITLNFRQQAEHEKILASLRKIRKTQGGINQLVSLESRLLKASIPSKCGEIKLAYMEAYGKVIGLDRDEKLCRFGQITDHINAEITRNLGR